MKKDPLPLLNLIAQAIYDKKGFNILALDLRKISTLTDFVIIAEGNVDRHVSAIAGAITDALKKIGETPVYVEGLESGDWIVLDYIQVMIHLFSPGLRDKYQLEKLWGEGEIVDLTIATTSEVTATYK